MLEKLIENYLNHGGNDSTRHNYPLCVNTNVYAKGNYDLQFRKELCLDDYYMQSFICQIEGCGCEFIFNKYFCFYECYYSVNGEPEKSTGGNVVNFMVVPGIKIKVRSFETFNFVVDGKKYFSINFPINKTVGEFKKLVKEHGIELLSLYGFTRYSEIPKIMKDDETFECVKGQEFNIELSSHLTIINLNNSLNGIERFKANINIKNH